MKYSGSNIRISLWQVIKDNRAKSISIMIVFVVLAFCIVYFYEINRERLEVLDFELSETNPEIPLIDTVDIQIYHSYKSEFKVDDNSTAVRKHSTLSKIKGPSLVFDAVFSMRKMESFNPNEPNSYFSDYIELTPSEVSSYFGFDPEYYEKTSGWYRYFKSVKFSIFCNQRTSHRNRTIEESSSVIDSAARRISRYIHKENGDSLILINQYLSDISGSQDSPNRHAFVYRYGRFFYYGAKEPVPIAVRYKIRNQSTYNLFFKRIDIDIKNCNHKQITIAFPSSVVFELITVEPDRRTATSITYSSEESFKMLRENGLYINARPLGSSNFIDSRNFILATLIGGLFSIFADLVISVISEFNERRKNRRGEERGEK